MNAPDSSGRREAADSRFSELLDQARHGSRDAIGEAVGQFDTTLRRWARRLSRRMLGGGQTSDLVQTAQQHAVANLPQFRGRTISELRAWLRSIVTNQARMLARSKLREPEFKPFTNDSSGRPMELVDGRTKAPIESLLRGEASEMVRQSVAALSEENRRIIFDYAFENASIESIAAERAISTNAARPRLRRALAALAVELRRRGWRPDR